MYVIMLDSQLLSDLSPAYIPCIYVCVNRYTASVKLHGGTSTRQICIVSLVSVLKIAINKAIFIIMNNDKRHRIVYSFSFFIFYILPVGISMGSFKIGLDMWFVFNVKTVVYCIAKKNVTNVLWNRI